MRQIHQPCERPKILKIWRFDLGADEALPKEVAGGRPSAGFVLFRITCLLFTSLFFFVFSQEAPHVSIRSDLPLVIKDFRTWHLRGVVFLSFFFSLTYFALLSADRSETQTDWLRSQLTWWVTWYLFFFLLFSFFESTILCPLIARALRVFKKSFVKYVVSWFTYYISVFLSLLISSINKVGASVYSSWFFWS